mgnify:FL=1
MAYLSEEESDRIREAVAAAESSSGGEITTAIIAESDDYGFRELLVALVGGVVAWSAAIAAQDPLAALLQRVLWGWEPWMLAVIQGAIGMLAGLVMYYLLQIPALDRLIIPRRVMNEAVRRRAARHFVESGTYDTVDNTGVLIFVSLLERRVELIADRGINAVVPSGTWDSIVADLTRGIRDDNLSDAMVTAVTRVGEVLAGKVQRRPDDENELTNRTSELEKGS